MRNPLFWTIPKALVALFLGVFLAGIILAVAVPALGTNTPRWLPWTTIVASVGLTYWALHKGKSRGLP